MNDIYFDERSEYDMRTVFTKAVGQEIYRIRRSRVMTGKELAIQLNVSQQQVSRYERGICNITVDTLILILNVLNVSIDEFFKHVYLNISDIKGKVDESYQRIFLSLKENDKNMFKIN
ncbi:helix-turn-helix transcriptional regulator [Providencia stuartii]|uniref:helix-turn-helix domain-containing protein n=1 Tax=Providencia TaxID=586 RepID=UPI0024B03E3A|nr:helix-turn-helix transcriptional regulator [Providencia sp. 2023EL-00965]ELR5302218.1 helix-turn-helix transcriptional regulator [Providencia stuartii]MDW7590686.1 helix-turn-helix transcriptional regulator [Providencia sp. 2023EL-00965]